MLENWIYFGVFLDADESERVYNIINSLPGIDIPNDWREIEPFTISGRIDVFLAK